LSLLSVFKV